MVICSVSNPCSIESGSGSCPKISSRIRIHKTPEHYLKIIYNYFLIIPFYHQNKSIERYNVVKSKIILCWFKILDLFKVFLSPWILIRLFQIQKAPESGSETLFKKTYILVLYCRRVTEHTGTRQVGGIGVTEPTFFWLERRGRVFKRLCHRLLKLFKKGFF